MRDKVIIIDQSGVFSRSIARKLRSEHIYCKILPATSGAEEIRAQAPLGLILAGGDSGNPTALDPSLGWTECGIPVLAMGDAALALCIALGGSLGARDEASAVVNMSLTDTLPALTDQVQMGQRFLPHARTLLLGGGMLPAALTESGALGFCDRERQLFGMAFQVERNDPDGVQLLLNFCRNVCGCTPWWNNQSFVELAVEEIRRSVGDGEAVCALSGGVDSGVCALLGNMAIGSRLHCIFVDTGLLRKDESRRVMSFYGETAGLNLTRVDARETFLTALKGIRRAEEKEEVIFRLLTQTLEKAMEGLVHVRTLLQGTNYSDAPAEASTQPLAAHMKNMRVIEPVRELFKDEIRRVGEELGLPPIIIQRQPFPGSGLALRVLSDVTEEKLNILREADAIFRGEIEESGQSKRLWQYFATLSENPDEDGRNMVVGLRAVQVFDGSAAIAARLPYDLLEKTVQLIQERLPQVRRVVYDLTPSENYQAVEWR